MLWIIFVSENQICNTFLKNVLLSSSESRGQRRVSLGLETARYSETTIYKSTRSCVPEEFLKGKFVRMINGQLTAPYER